MTKMPRMKRASHKTDIIIMYCGLSLTWPQPSRWPRHWNNHQWGWCFRPLVSYCLIIRARAQRGCFRRTPEAGHAALSINLGAHHHKRMTTTRRLIQWSPWHRRWTGAAVTDKVCKV